MNNNNFDDVSNAYIFFFPLSTASPPLVFFVFSLFLFTFPPMDAGDTAHRILSLLGGSPMSQQCHGVEKQQLLKNMTGLIQSEPKVAPTPSLSAAGDYLRIFRHLLRSAFFRTADVRSRHGIMGSALGPLRGNGYSRKSRAIRPRIPGFVALACPRICPAPVMQSWNGPSVITHFISHLAL